MKWLETFLRGPRKKYSEEGLKKALAVYQVDWEVYAEHDRRKLLDRMAPQKPVDEG